jgi:hypothetical protein
MALALGLRLTAPPGTFRARRALRTQSSMDHKPGGGSWILSLWTSKEGANSVGPPDFGSQRNRLQLQSIGLKNRINSCLGRRTRRSLQLNTKQVELVRILFSIG